MPEKSKAQEAFLAINHPEVLKKWKAEGASLKTKGLPQHVAGSKFVALPKMKKMKG